MANERAKLTKRAVDAAQPPATGEARLWDDELTGFCLRLYASGRKVYAVKYRVGARQRWFTIGEHGDPWTPDGARTKAKSVIGAAAEGRDPASDKRADRAALAVAELIDLYLADGPATKPAKRAASWAVDASNLNRHARPLLGSKLARDVSRADVGRMVQAVTEGETAADVKTKKQGRAIVRGGPAAAARALAAVRAMYAWGLEHKHLTGENPAKGVRLAASSSPERYLSDTEAAGLFATLDGLEAAGKVTPAQAAIFRLLLLTGARRDEVAALRWSEVDFARKRLVLPPERTKGGGRSGEKRIALNTVALAILEAQPRPEGAVWVFPATKGKSGHTTSAGKVWREKVRPAAKLAGVRLHDLRHSFASFALADGASLPMIGKALGHANSRSTERYAHLADDPLRALSERVAGRLGGKA